MIGEIIAIGDELTSGRIANTTSSFAASQLFTAGHEIFAMHTIGDTPALIGEALKRAINRVDFVIVTGGLGATTDDMTNEAVAAALNRPPTLHREILNKIRPKKEGSSNRDLLLIEKLAWLPEGAEVLNVESRMAGYLLVYNSTPIFFLPGIPHQMKELFVEHVLPCLAGWSMNNRNHIRQKVYRTFGISENEINQKLQDVETTPRVKIGYYPVDSDVHVSLTVMDNSSEESDILFNNIDAQIINRLGDTIYGVNHDTMASVIGGLLNRKGWQISIAESCTGGLVSGKITETPGCSDWFAGSIVAYSNALKKQLLSVSSELLDEHGAVSSPVARAMVSGVTGCIATQVGVSITGIAGPTGGSDEKPVGTVFIGIAVNDEIHDHRFLFSGSRKEIQEKSAQTALDLVRRSLMMVL